MFSEERYRNKFLEAWNLIAKRCKERGCVYAYDLVNEPVEPREGAKIAWPELATQAIDVIRAIDPGKTVVFELGPVPSRPYHPTLTHAVFRGWDEFGAGALGDMQWL